MRLSYEFKPSKSLPGYIDFDKSTGRKPFNENKPDYDPRGLRFVERPIPKNSSKYRPIQGFEFRKMADRDMNKTMYAKSHQNLTDINPNFDFVKKGTDKRVPFLGKLSKQDYFSGRFERMKEEKYQDFLRKNRDKRNRVMYLS